ncbi:MAG: hypothetical protein Q8P40_10715 [Nitrospirota bacterium]|nr:hypothetical protein [Nitrospirota bacterium]
MDIIIMEILILVKRMTTLKVMRYAQKRVRRKARSKRKSLSNNKHRV